jgi:hypothetical protein
MPSSLSDLTPTLNVFGSCDRYQLLPLKPQPDISILLWFSTYNSRISLQYNFGRSREMLCLVS